MEQKLFGYPEFDENGEEILSTYDNEYSDMMMDVRVYQMKENEVRTFYREGEESAFLLLSGKIEYRYDDQVKEVYRKDVFTDGPYALHVCTGVRVEIQALSDVLLLVQCTKNETVFDCKLYTPVDAPWGYSCVGKFGNVAKRRVNTIFDKDIAPWSNMVLGEVLNDPGNWSGYLPHRHPQPELYYFKFDRPEGFGASFIDDQVFKSVDNSFSAITPEALHPQVCAPGFQMYTCWMIRHLDGNPWLQSTRNEDERYIWLHNANF